jgi:long-chain fatty acid transport protein
MKRRHRLSPWVFVLGLCAATPAAALASGFQLVEQNGSGLGNAYAGQAAGVANASAVFFNPAALTDVDGRQFLVSVSPVGVSTEFADSGSARPTLGPVAIPVSLGGSGGDAGGWLPVPNAYLSWKAASRVWLGFGVNVPFGLKTEWEPDWVGRFHAVKSEVRTVNLNPTVAVKVTDWLSLGAGANYQRLAAELSQSVAYGGIAVGAASRFGPAAQAGILAQLGGPAGLTREGLARVEGHDWNWGFNVGARARIGDSGNLGVSYRSKVKHEIQGDAAFTDAPRFLTAGPLGALGAGLNARFANGPVSTQVELPDTLSVAGAYAFDRFELLADWTWTGWSSIQKLEIVRDDGNTLSEVPLLFEDTWRVGLGVNYALADDWRLRLGTAFDQTPVQDAYRTPRLPDQDRIWAAAGVEFKVGKGALDVGYAHLFVKDATSRLPNQDTPESAPAGVLLGTYPGRVDLLSVQYRISF